MPLFAHRFRPLPRWVGPVQTGAELARRRHEAGHPLALIANLAVVPPALLAHIEASAAGNRYRSERERVAAVLAALEGEQT